jgi:hypothetical protein
MLHLKYYCSSEAGLTFKKLQTCTGIQSVIFNLEAYVACSYDIKSSTPEFRLDEHATANIIEASKVFVLSYSSLGMKLIRTKSWEYIRRPAILPMQ